MMKRTILAMGLALLFVLLFSTIVHADVTITAAASRSEIEPGESFDIVVKYEGIGEKIAGIQFLPVFPEGITLVNTSNNRQWIMPGGVIAYTSAASAEDDIEITLACTTADDIEGDLVISFSNVRYAGVDSYTSKGELPSITLAAPSASLKGDANDDGAVDIMDLVVIVDYIVNGSGPASMAGADANDDGAVDIMDLVFIINLIVNPLVSSGTQVDATAGNMISVEVPFQSAVPITALEMEYNLSPGLTFVNASCSGMVGEGGSTNAVFVNVSGGVTSGTVTLEVALNNGVTANQTINVTAIMGASTSGLRSIGTPQTYVIDVNASALAILTQPTDATVSVGNTATFTVEAAGTEPLTYQWYVNTNTGVGWLAITDATENTYTTDAAELGDDGFRYYCRVTDANRESADSAVATLTVVASPQTGDSSHPYWLLALALLAAAGLLYIVYGKRYKQRHSG